LEEGVTARPWTAYIATVVVATLSIAWAAAADRGADPIGWLLSLAVGATGLIVAAGLWRRRPWSLAAYAAWAILALARHVYGDVQVEPVLAKVAAGTAIVAAILVAIGIVARHSQRPTSGHTASKTTRSGEVPESRA
jgi:hypothetical protein